MLLNQVVLFRFEQGRKYKENKRNVFHGAEYQACVKWKCYIAAIGIKRMRRLDLFGRC